MNRENEVDIEELRQEITRLRLAAENIERWITASQEERNIQDHQQEIERNRRPPNYRYSHTHSL